MAEVSRSLVSRPSGVAGSAGTTPRCLLFPLLSHVCERTRVSSGALQAGPPDSEGRSRLRSHRSQHVLPKSQSVRPSFAVRHRGSPFCLCADGAERVAGGVGLLWLPQRRAVPLVPAGPWASPAGPGSPGTSPESARSSQRAWDVSPRPVLTDLPLFVKVCFISRKPWGRRKQTHRTRLAPAWSWCSGAACGRRGRWSRSRVRRSCGAAAANARRGQGRTTGAAVSAARAVASRRTGERCHSGDGGGMKAKPRPGPSEGTFEFALRENSAGADVRGILLPSARRGDSVSDLSLLLMNQTVSDKGG